MSGNREENREDKSDQAVDVAFAAVIVQAGFDQLRNQHRIEHTADDDGIDIVGQLICDSEGVGGVGCDTDG
mgnify:CR=1 FL=1